MRTTGVENRRTARSDEGWSSSDRSKRRSCRAAAQPIDVARNDLGDKLLQLDGVLGGRLDGALGPQSPNRQRPDLSRNAVTAPRRSSFACGHPTLLSQNFFPQIECGNMPGGLFAPARWIRLPRHCRPRHRARPRLNLRPGRLVGNRFAVGPAVGSVISERRNHVHRPKHSLHVASHLLAGFTHVSNNLLTGATVAEPPPPIKSVALFNTPGRGYP